MLSVNNEDEIVHSILNFKIKQNTERVISVINYNKYRKLHWIKHVAREEKWMNYQILNYRT